MKSNHHADPGHAHTHDHHAVALDPQLLSHDRGIRATRLSFAWLFSTAVLQLIVVFMSGSIALLADTIHNFADALTAIPLWLAFYFSKRKPNDRFTYGYGRLEDLAGLFVILMILGSALSAGYFAMDRLLHPQPLQNVPIVFVASVIGFLGNEAVAIYRIKTGKQIGSAALVADGYHARTDALTSLAVIPAVLGAWMGYPVADPLIALAITAVILRILIQSSKPVLDRLLDSTDPQIVAQIRLSASGVPGVQEVTQARVRWIGHWMHAELNVTVDAHMTVAEGHEIAMEARHRLLHDLPYLSGCTVHVDPSGSSGEDHHRIEAHQHDESPVHSH